MMDTSSHKHLNMCAVCSYIMPRGDAPLTLKELDKTPGLVHVTVEGEDGKGVGVVVCSQCINPNRVISRKRFSKLRRRNRHRRAANILKHGFGS